ncbi:uncharacterized protein I303_105552 [Kwoniella dejecticola CBS 10117]|uniref:Uncharacterized protein n=1 Tax=Kwoniella dejecticola CBS 10117 TaxID=1296121 RepID=A0A1A6A259_9TREE|nr:uncharacterized protein I303_05005 [Kwoniella dejecticola CBS 10117]OBR84148.1 hypothetical protein I303_05005 [Kwoniella dejecticola CBS 10117]
MNTVAEEYPEGDEWLFETFIHSHEGISGTTHSSPIGVGQRSANVISAIPFDAYPIDATEEWLQGPTDAASTPVQGIETHSTRQDELGPSSSMYRTLAPSSDTGDSTNHHQHRGLPSDYSRLSITGKRLYHILSVVPQNINLDHLDRYSHEICQTQASSGVLLPYPDWYIPNTDRKTDKGKIRSIHLSGYLSRYDPSQGCVEFSSNDILDWVGGWIPDTQNVGGTIQILEEKWCIRYNTPDGARNRTDRRTIAKDLFKRSLIRSAEYLLRSRTGNEPGQRYQWTRATIEQEEIDLRTMVYVADRLLWPWEGQEGSRNGKTLCASWKDARKTAKQNRA